MPPYWVRLLYVVEFLLALIAVSLLWSEVGGQGHLDLMPWYQKLVLTVALAWVTVAGTVSSVARERVWNRWTVGYILAGLLIAAAMALLTYYYHIHEDDDGDGAHDSVALFAARVSGRQS